MKRFPEGFKPKLVVAEAVTVAATVVAGALVTGTGIGVLAMLGELMLEGGVPVGAPGTGWFRNES
jgi:hypothetical protein